MRRLRVKKSRKQQRLSESQEIKLLEEWIEARKPDSGTNPLAIPAQPPTAPVGRTADGGFTPYADCKLFRQLPISRKTKEGLAPKYKEMSEIQRASLPHSLCGRDILGAAKTGSGKTLAFIIPVVEKLYRARWGPEDGVGSIIISPTKELAGQLFEELKVIGKNHTLSAGLLIGGRKDVDAEKDRVSSLNILICTPGRLLQHMNETPNFECSQLQVLVLDEADRMLDKKFKGELDAIISQLPKRRQTLLFSATQTKSVKDLARLSLKDPEYISVHAESVTATPERLKQVAMEVPLDQKLNMLWSFIKSHLRSKMIVFLSTCKQVDCPEDVAAYIHRVGRTARFTSEGNSVLFLLPSEREMLTKLQSAEPKIPIQLRKVKSEKMEQISGSLASVLVKYPEMQQLAKRAFITYVRSINHQKDKEVFDVSKLPLEEYSASLGLPMKPNVSSKSQKMKNKKETVVEQEHKVEVEGEVLYNVDGFRVDVEDGRIQKLVVKMMQGKAKSNRAEEEEEDDDILVPTKSSVELDKSELTILPTRILKKKKLKINVHRPVGTRVKYDDDGNQVAPLAAFAITEGADTILEPEKVKERYEKLREEMKQHDKEDKVLLRQRLRDKRTKDKMKLKRWREEEEDDEDINGDDSETDLGRKSKMKNSKINFESESDDDRKMKKMKGFDADVISLAEQEALALKLLSSMHNS
ncbi:DEAD-box ATP-dependent RNA helicase 32 isoform X2 [Dendrobium catenatum]|uniref:DEAD-box ATP-dependent RNA helicase 32 isoform X2 n=1 Tax=Dendrobium catenatum TaxID=906689 RepID=UPI0009F5E3D0|nr:DEAD-box ATP-dependent RNA helicase 32 isoform X2 [Dendrobium catenatum]